MCEVTQKAADEAFKYAKAVPADKIDWKPLDLGRSVLDQCKEMAMCAGWCQDIIDAEKPPEFSEESMAAIQKEQEQWKTVEDCQAEAQRRMDKLFAFFRELPDERLTEKKWLPFDGGREFTVTEMMDYPRWNFNYHLGQVAYIQTLFGDKEMH